jgi:hypothetical protein
MSVENKDFVEAAELLSNSEGTKAVEIKSLNGKKIEIKKINVGEIAAILKVSKDSDLEQWMFLVFKGLIRPKMGLEDIKRLPIDVLSEIAFEIQKYSGLDKESMGRLENLLRTKSSPQSSK